MRTIGAKDKVAMRNMNKMKVYNVSFVGHNNEYQVEATNRDNAIISANNNFKAYNPNQTVPAISEVIFSQYA